MNINEFLSHFDKKHKAGSGWRVCCPTHLDVNPSLSISEKDGKILWFCHAGCERDTVTEALRAKIPGLLPESSDHRAADLRPFDYVDEAGNLLYQNVRNYGNGSKCFFRRPDGHGGWEESLNGTRRVPYRLPDLIKAKAGEVGTIYLCEGEKDADAVRLLGFTSSNFKLWKPEFNQWLQGAQIVIFRDHDAPGVKLADDAAAIVGKAAAAVRIIDPWDGEPLADKDGRDVSDWIAARRRDEGLDDAEIAARIVAMVEKAISAAAAETADAEEQTELKPFPVPSEECFAGLAGEIIRLISPHSEADPMALLAQFLTYFGSIAGRGPHVRVEADRHHANLFALLVGATGSGRKGTAFRVVKDLFAGVDEDHDRECHAGGLASGEGLIWRVRDPGPERTGRKGEASADPGVTDKRLLVVEGEFVQVFRVQNREGATLSGTIRNLWDTGTVENLTKNTPQKTTNAHVSIIGHITPEELVNTLSEIEASNGYANRFLYLMVKRNKLLPFGGRVPEFELKNAKTQLTRAVEFAKNVGEMTLSYAARELWTREYERLETSRVGYLAKITQRASPYVLRLSCIFALLDRSDEIAAKHLEAGLAVWKFAEDSARYIFGGRIGKNKAEKILEFLKISPNGATRTEIRDLFSRHIERSELDAALKLLVDAGLARVERAKGSKTETWFHA